MSDVYMYQAAFYCVPCGQDLPVCPNPDCDDTDHDSDEYRKGPYPDGGGESDSPDHCDDCRGFLENPLTDDGIAYVVEELNEFYRFGIEGFIENNCGWSRAISPTLWGN